MAADKTVHHTYQLNAGGYDRSRKTQAVLCDLRDALKATPNNPVSDVVIFAPGRNETLLAATFFAELARQRPAGANALYVAVEWPCFVASQQPAVEETGKSRFNRLFADIRATFRKGADAEEGVDLKVIEDLEATCLRYMQDVDRLVKYGKKGDERFPSDLRNQLVELMLAFGRQGSRSSLDIGICDDMKPPIEGGSARYGQLNSLRVDDLQRVALKSQEIEESLSKTMAYFEATETTDDTEGPGHRDSERHWLVLCRVIATAFSRGLERRASVVGQRGMYNLLCDLMRHTSNQTRFHLAGHSYGAHLGLSGTFGASLPRRVHSLYIAQPSVHSSAAAPRNPYRPLSDRWCPVAGVHLAICAPKTRMLYGHDTMDDSESLARRGWRGIRPNKMAVRRDEQAKPKYRPGAFYSVDASDMVTDTMDDVCCTPELVTLLWQAVNTRLPEDAYKTVDPARLPEKYWTSYRARTRRRLCVPALSCSCFCWCK